jgi:hypothetical protein
MKTKVMEFGNFKKVENYIENQVYLDEKYWNYSRTTSKYRNMFLEESGKEIERKIKKGIYLLANLNENIR